MSDNEIIEHEEKDVYGRQIKYRLSNGNLNTTDWTDCDIANFYKNYELNVVKFPRIDYRKFKKLIDVYDQRYLHAELYS